MTVTFNGRGPDRRIESFTTTSRRYLRRDDNHADRLMGLMIGLSLGLHSKNSFIQEDPYCCSTSHSTVTGLVETLKRLY